MKKPLRCFFAVVIAIIFLLSGAGQASSQITGFVARDGLDIHYQYPYEKLLQSYVLSILGEEGQLYQHYAGRRTTALVDDSKGYVDYSDILEAYAVSVITSQPFDLDAYVAANAVSLDMPPTVRMVNTKAGELVQEELWTAREPAESMVERVTADQDGPVPVLTRVRWSAEGISEGMRYTWYIYRDGRHVRTIRNRDEDWLDFVPTDAGVYKIRVFAVCPGGCASDSYSEELTVEETVIIEKPFFDFRDSLKLILEPIEKIIQHHMANPTWDVFEVHDFHRNRIHWLDADTWEYWTGIGYNYWIGFDGTIYETRGRHYGSHAGGNWNGRSLGVGYQGDFTYQKMTDEQVMSGAWLNAKLLIDEGLGVEDIWGHGDVGNTACPGKNFRAEDLFEETARILRGVFEGQDQL